MRNLVVSQKFDGKKLTAYLSHEFPNLSQGAIYKALRKKDIRVNDIKVSENITIHEGDDIKIYIIDSILFGEEKKLNVIYEGENILAVNKPKGIEVTGEKSLTDLVHKQYNNSSIMPCHRLDRNTEGIVLFAKNKEVLEILFEKFQNHEIVKYYKCKVIGIPKKKHDVLEAYLFKDTKKSIVYVSNEKKQGYRPIKTEYTILEENKEKNYSILQVILHTGRTHQIRAHLAHIGHPIIGDGKYGINEVNKKFGEKTQNLESYKIKFDFKTNSGMLAYLNGKEIKI